MRISNLRPILVVDDNDEDFEILQLSLSVTGAKNRLMRCLDGAEALGYLRGALHEGRGEIPCIVLLDLNLPGVDGRQVLSTIKSDEKMRGVPVIILSTSVHLKDVEFCYAHGANSYCLKPLDLERFENFVAVLKAFWLDNTVLPHDSEAMVVGET